MRLWVQRKVEIFHQVLFVNTERSEEPKWGQTLAALFNRLCGSSPSYPTLTTKGWRCLLHLSNIAGKTSYTPGKVSSWRKKTLAQERYDMYIHELFNCAPLQPAHMGCNDRDWSLRFASHVQGHVVAINNDVLLVISFLHYITKWALRKCEIWQQILTFSSL